jgi:hypothetical protein
MRKSKFTEAQIIKVLKQHSAGLSAGDLCRKDVQNGAGGDPSSTTCWSTTCWSITS